MGSSPLARGSLHVDGAGARDHGLIPARAGFTCRWAAPVMGEEAHPRSRGAHTFGLPAESSSAGSSPLARGSRVLMNGLQRGRGLIPARAGLTCPGASRCRPWWAHPRSRGAHSPSAAAACTPAGSSPLARGSHPGPRTVRARRGLIPARAGLTPGAATPPARSRAHPRSRGAHMRATWEALARAGSSPLARGSLAALVPEQGVGGLIPARAGLTAYVGICLVGGRAHPRSRGAHLRSPIRGF